MLQKIDRTILTIATSADANYFELVRGFEENVKKVFGEYPIVADIGLLDEQKKQIKSQISDHIVKRNFLHNSSEGFIRAVHKPKVIRELLQRFKTPLLLLDTDMVITSKFDFSIFDDCDMAITSRHRRELRAQKNLANGNLNSGFLFFRNTTEVHDLIDRWEDLCEMTEKSDQRALSDLLEDFDITSGFGLHLHNGLALKVLEPNLYNDVASKSGYIFHIKGSGRSIRLHSRWYRYNWLALHMGFVLKIKAAFYRKLLSN